MSRRLPLAYLTVLALATAVPSAGEDPPDAREPSWRGAGLAPSWRRSLPESEALRIPTPITRDEEVERVTLKEAIGIALENNPGIAAQRLEPTRQGAGVLQAGATFDPTLSGELTHRNSITPNASALAGTHPITPLGRPGRGTDIHVASAMVYERRAMYTCAWPSKVRKRRCPTTRALGEGFSRAAAASCG